jgi:hypothetical protein
MGMAALEDLQGTIEVVVFPRLYEQTLGTWADGSILLVAGRVDHRGDEVSILADLVVDWDTALQRGPEAFAREAAAGDRGASRRRPRGGGPTQRPQASNGNGRDGAPDVPMPVAVGPGRPSVALTPRGVPRVSPLRPDAVDPRQSGGPARPTATLPTIVPAEPVGTYLEPSGVPELGPEHDDEPALPDEARARAAAEAIAPTTPSEAGTPSQTLHVRFSGLSPERTVGAMEALKSLLGDRPGGTRVVLHVQSSSGGAALPMELRRGVAYDSELLAEVRRRLGEGVVDLQLA